MIVQEFDPKLPYVFIRYGRMSDPNQNPRSPEQQFATADEVLLRLGYSWVHLRDYRDDGISGRYVSKRPGFSQMLLDIRTRTIQVDLILVDTLERFGRMDQLEAIQRELRTEYGVFIVSAETNFANPTGEAGRALEFFQNMRATSAGRVKAHDVKRGKIDSARRKRWPGGPAPLGLQLKRIIEQLPNGREDLYSILIRDADTAWIIQEIFSLAYEKGWGAVRIVKHLNDRADVVAKVGKLEASTIHRLLGSEIYIGALVFGKTATDVINDRRVVQALPADKWVRVEGFCEALIDREIFDDVLRQRDQRSAARRPKKSESDKLVKPASPGMTLNYPLSGLVRCPECRAAMRVNASGSKSSNGRRYAYYRCPLFISGRCENNVSVPEDWLREAVLAKLRSRLVPLDDHKGNGALGNGRTPSWLPELVNEIRQAWTDIHRHEPDRRPALEKELRELEAGVVGWT